MSNPVTEAWVRGYNLIEVFLWLGFGLLLVFQGGRRGEKHRWFCLAGAMIFGWASLSEWAEMGTGAWWRPWWMLGWKGSVGVLLGGWLLWYIRIQNNEGLGDAGRRDEANRNDFDDGGGDGEGGTRGGG